MGTNVTKINASGTPERPASQIEIPEWVTETPAEMTYDLEVFDASGGSIEEVGMTRAEYIALKRTLAKMRGFDVPEAEPTVAAEVAAPTNGAAASAREVDRTYTLAAFEGGGSTETHDLDKHQFEFLRTCLKIHQNDHGCITPFEEFLTHLVHCYDLGHTAAEDVQHLFEEFQEGWKTTVEDIGIVMRHSPKLIEEAKAASEAA